MRSLERITLVDANPALVAAWAAAFAGVENVEVMHGDYFSARADAMVSPANSFGFMDGGVDLRIRNHFGMQIEHRVRREIRDQFHGELCVGEAVIVPTTDKRGCRWLIAAPTMRVPADVSNTLNAYLAFRAVGLAIEDHNLCADCKIRTLVCCGLATATGRMAPKRCATQMRVAYDRTSDSPPHLRSLVDVCALDETMTWEATC